jgi:prepilin-type N-terminal cleavage/methylation domain-containing protein/prepilin-type processing-associated H-X9-DG protein
VIARKATEEERKVMKSPVKTNAFTLIELLTVIAIIGILATILIPVVGRVRESAKGSLCRSNLRQIGIAAHLYAAENDDLLPPARAANIAALEASTRDAFDMYLDKGYEVFYCPNEGIASSRTIWDPHGSWHTPQYRGGFSIGYFWLGNPTVPGFGNPMGLWMDARGTGDPRDNYLIRVTEPDAALIAIAADHTQQGGGPGTWILRHPQSTTGSNNVLYGDGHVETKSATEIRARWNASRPIAW